MASSTSESLFLQQRPRLIGLAYRMLGSVMDAEDIVQDVFVTWSEADRSAIREPGAFLTTLVTRRCIDELRSARKRRESYIGPWLPDPLVEDPSAVAEQDESVGIAFLLLLERLRPVERAVFVLREVLDYPYTEIAPVVDRSVVACRQIMSRARRAIEAAPAPPVSRSEHNPELIARFVQASRDGDVELLLSTLADDAVLIADGGGVVTAARKPIVGAAKVRGALLAFAKKVDPRGQALPATINGLPGFVYVLDGRVALTLALAIEGGVIRSIYNVVNPDKLRHLSATA